MEKVKNSYEEKIFKKKIDSFIKKEIGIKTTASLAKRVNIKGFELIETDREWKMNNFFYVKYKSKKVLKEIYFFDDIIVQIKINKPTKKSASVLFLKHCDISFSDKDDEFSVFVQNRKIVKNTFYIYIYLFSFIFI